MSEKRSLDVLNENRPSRIQENCKTAKGSYVMTDARPMIAFHSRRVEARSLLLPLLQLLLTLTASAMLVRRSFSLRERTNGTTRKEDEEEEEERNKERMPNISREEKSRGRLKPIG